MLGRLLIGRARSTNQAGDWGVAAEYAQQLREKHKENVEPLLLTAELYLCKRQPDEARKLLTAAKNDADSERETRQNERLSSLEKTCDTASTCCAKQSDRLDRLTTPPRIGPY
jgi:thioredoxin-like negative regulator of GroEL